MIFDRNTFLKHYRGFDFDTYILMLDTSERKKELLQNIYDNLHSYLGEDEMFNIFNKVLKGIT
jgi:hypothetical protein